MTQQEFFYHIFDLTLTRELPTFPLESQTPTPASPLARMAYTPQLPDVP